MAGRKKRQQKRNRRRIRRSTNRRSVRQAQPAIGRVVATGVKSLVSSIPLIGPVLGSIADFGFKAIGLTNVVPEGATLKFKEANVAMTALVSRFIITPSTLLVGSRSCVQMNMGRKVATQYRDGRVISLTVRVQPMNPVGKRGGDWHLAIQPFFNVKDREQKGMIDNWYPTAQGLHHMYLSCTGPASQPLQLTYKPRVSDGEAFSFNPLDQEYAEIVIRWDQPVRSDYSEFTADDFACETIVSGKLEQRMSPSMPPTADGGYTFETTVNDKLSGIGMFVISKGIRAYAIQAEGFSCKPGTRNCVITGTASTGRPYSASELDIGSIEIVDRDMFEASPDRAENRAI